MRGLIVVMVMIGLSAKASAQSDPVPEVSTTWNLGPEPGLASVIASSPGLPSVTFSAFVIARPEPSPFTMTGFAVWCGVIRCYDLAKSAFSKARSLYEYRKWQNRRLIGFHHYSESLPAIALLLAAVLAIQIVKRIDGYQRVFGVDPAPVPARM